MKLIVGLGNPGARYEHTRHNVGFDVVDLLATRWQVRVATEKFHGWFGKGEIAGASAVLLKPTTLMNRSGRAVVAAGRFYKLEIADLMVVVDDLALPVGRVRVRMGGSSGGHNGLQDIIDRAGSDAWCRTRIGIGVPAGDSVRYVLGRFDPQEEEVMRPTRERGADAVECWVAHGVDETMNRFNADPTRG